MLIKCFAFPFTQPYTTSYVCCRPPTLWSMYESLYCLCLMQAIFSSSWYWLCMECAWWIGQLLSEMDSIHQEKRIRTSGKCQRAFFKLIVSQWWWYTLHYDKRCDIVVWHNRYSQKYSQYLTHNLSMKVRYGAYNPSPRLACSQNFLINIIFLFL